MKLSTLVSFSIMKTCIWNNKWRTDFIFLIIRRSVVFTEIIGSNTVQDWDIFYSVVTLYRIQIMLNRGNHLRTQSAKLGLWECSETVISDKRQLTFKSMIILKAHDENRQVHDFQIKLRGLIFSISWLDSGSSLLAEVVIKEGILCDTLCYFVVESRL